MTVPYKEKITVRFRKPYIVIEQGEDEIVLTPNQAISLMHELARRNKMVVEELDADTIS